MKAISMPIKKNNSLSFGEGRGEGDFTVTHPLLFVSKTNN